MQQLLWIQSRIKFTLRRGPAGLILAPIGESRAYADFPLPLAWYATPWHAKAEDRDARSAKLPASAQWSAMATAQADPQPGLQRESAGMT